MNDLSMTNIQKKTKNPLNRADDMFGWKKVAEVRKNGKEFLVTKNAKLLFAGLKKRGGLRTDG